MIRSARVEFAGDTPRSLEFDEQLLHGRPAGGGGLLGKKKSQAGVLSRPITLPGALWGHCAAVELFVVGETGFGTGLNVLLAG